MNTLRKIRLVLFTLTSMYALTALLLFNSDGIINTAHLILLVLSVGAVMLNIANSEES